MNCVIWDLSLAPDEKIDYNVGKDLYGIGKVRGELYLFGYHLL